MGDLIIQCEFWLEFARENFFQIEFQLRNCLIGHKKLPG